MSFTLYYTSHAFVIPLGTINEIGLKLHERVHLTFNFFLYFLSNPIEKKKKVKNILIDLYSGSSLLFVLIFVLNMGTCSYFFL
jgi:hypothetical protein